VLQYVAVRISACCSILQRVAVYIFRRMYTYCVCCSMLQCDAVCVAPYCSALQCIYLNALYILCVLQNVAVRCSVCCSMLQCVAMRMFRCMYTYNIYTNYYKYSFHRDIDTHMTFPTENATPPKSSKSRNSNSSVQIQIEPKS